jgi:hypothetical protein
VLVLAALTVQEAARRRVIRSLVVLTTCCSCSARGASPVTGVETEAGELTSGESRIVASQLLNLVMFGLSLIAALGTTFLAGPTLSARWSRGRPSPSSPARSAARRSCSASGWAW